MHPDETPTPLAPGPAPSSAGAERAATDTRQSPRLRPASAMRVLLAGALLPGWGHWMLGLRKRSLMFGCLWAAATMASLYLGQGQPVLHLHAEPAHFFEATWIAVTAWLIAALDLALSLHESTPPQPNARVALLANLCSRGLGYFYLDRPLLGAAALCGLAAWDACTRDVDSGLPHPLTPLLHVALGVHAWLLAQPARLRLALGPRQVAAGITCCVLLAAGSLGVERLVEQGCTNLALTQAEEQRARGTSQYLPAVGIRITLPSAAWSVDGAIDSRVVTLRSSRGRVTVFRSDAPAGLGLEGFIVELAGQLASKHGEVRLENQQRWPAPHLEVREILYTWQEGLERCCSHVFLAAQHDEVYAFLASSTAPLDAAGREEVARLVRSVRLTR